MLRLTSDTCWAHLSWRYLQIPAGRKHLCEKRTSAKSQVVFGVFFFSVSENYKKNKNKKTA